MYGIFLTVAAVAVILLAGLLLALSMIALALAALVFVGAVVYLLVREVVLHMRLGWDADGRKKWWAELF